MKICHKYVLEKRYENYYGMTSLQSIFCYVFTK